MGIGICSIQGMGFWVQDLGLGVPREPHAPKSKNAFANNGEPTPDNIESGVGGKSH